VSKTILVTGSSGFIGFNLSKLLMDNGDNVIGVDSYNNAYDPNFKRLRQKVLNTKNNFKEFELNLDAKENLESLEKENIDIVFHLAARAGVRQSFLDPISYIKDNSIATTNIANFVKDMNIKTLVLASTSSIYGDSGQEEMVEGVNEKIEPPSIYAASKLSGEVFAKNILEGTESNVVITRFFTVYGPFGRPDMSVLRFIHWVVEGKQLKLFGNGEQSRSFTYIDDVTELLSMCTDLNSNCTLNVGNNKTSTLNEVIKLIEEFTNKEALIDYQKRAYKDPDVVLPSLKNTKNITGWTPKTDISKGIENTVKWYFDNRDVLKELKYI
jgi:UDP-glucuronate 4-epimerase